jgi:predicted metal-dependent peptidase
METKLADAKVRLSMNPDLLFYVSVMAQLDIRLGQSPYGTAHTNGKEIVIQPEFMDTLSENALQGLILHEVRHVTDMHTQRLGDRDREKFNIACDHAINLDILKYGFELPAEGCADKQYTGLSAEEIYDLLPEGEKCEMPDLQGNEPSQGEDDQTPEQIAEDIQDILIQAVQVTQRSAGTAAGNIPEHVLRQVDAWINPVVPWYTLLQRYLTAKTKDDYSWSRPSRRGLPQGLYLPSMYSEQVGPINIYLDLSGSVTDEMVNMQIGQFKYIHRNIKPKELRIVTFTTRITDEFVFTPTDNINLQFHGSGGTSLREVAEHIQAHPAEVNLIFTDAYVSLKPMQGLKDEIVWCVYDNPTFTTDTGKVIII